MEDEVRIVSSISKEDWTRFVKENQYGNIFQTPEMEEVFSRTKRYEPLSLFAVDESDNILSSVLAYVSTEKGGMVKKVATRAVISGGPLFLNTQKGVESLKKLMHEYDEITSKKAMFTEIRMIYSIPEFSKLKSLGYGFEEHLNFHLDTNKPEKDVWEGVNKSKKRGIKKAQKEGVIGEEVADRGSIKIAYDILAQTYRRARIPLADVSLFESIFDIFGPLGQFKAFLFKHKEKPVATRILLTYKDRVYDWYNGSIDEGFSVCANDFSEWYAIKWGLDQGYVVFDFWGAGKPNEPYGPREFKKKFGGKLVNFGRYNRVYHPISLSIAQRGYEIYRRFFIR